MSLLEATSLSSDQLLFVKPTPIPGPPRPTTILLAEDNDELRIVMRLLLISMGYQVMAYSDGRLAAAAFRHQPAVDVLVTDLEMPGMSGLELAREVTTHRPSLPVLLVTASVLTVGNVKELVDRGWTYMSKPIEIEALRRTLLRLSTRNLRVSRLENQ